MKLQDVTFSPFAHKYRAADLSNIEAFARDVEIADDQPIDLEIGANRGRFLKGLARLHPERTVIGIEYRRKYARLARRRLARHSLDNAFVCSADVTLALPALFADGRLDRVFVLFPDPWWKKRHAKRRLLTPSFLALLGAKLRTGGVLIVKTDVEPYADHYTREVLEACPWFCRLDEAQLDEVGLSQWPKTTRERKIIEQGLPIWTIGARRNDATIPEDVDDLRAQRFAKPEQT